MKTQKIFNLSHLVSVKIKDKVINNYVTYQTHKKILFFTRKEGFIEKRGDTLKVYSKEDLEQGKYCNIKFIVEDKQVFYKPYVELRFSNGDNIVKQDFSNYEEALKWGNEQAGLGMDVKLIL